MAAYTRGPWRIGRPKNTCGGGGIVSDHSNGLPESGGWRDVDYYGGYLIAESVANPANQHLIAAAPALLEALERALPFFEYLEDEGPAGETWPSDHLLKAVDAARAAIALAKGEAL